MTIIVDVLILLGLGVCLVFAILGSLFVLWRVPTPIAAGQILCSNENIFTEQCQPVFYTLGRVQLVSVGLGAVAW